MKTSLRDAFGGVANQELLKSSMAGTPPTGALIPALLSCRMTGPPCRWSSCRKEDADHDRIALESGAKGYIPTSLSLDMAVGAMQFVEAGGTFVPASTLTARTRTGGEIQGQKGPLAGLFTERQAAVLECLRKGKANKQIAYELSMREGTVKVHVRNIMKKLKARNRTEVAVLTNPLLGHQKL
jgi:DNA-binding NarL/FixJ family response regulator